MTTSASISPSSSRSPSVNRLNIESVKLEKKMSVSAPYEQTTQTEIVEHDDKFEQTSLTQIVHATVNQFKVSDINYDWCCIDSNYRFNGKCYRWRCVSDCTDGHRGSWCPNDTSTDQWRGSTNFVGFHKREFGSNEKSANATFVLNPLLIQIRNILGCTTRSRVANSSIWCGGMWSSMWNHSKV